MRKGGKSVIKSRLQTRASLTLVHLHLPIGKLKPSQKQQPCQIFEFFAGFKNDVFYVGKSTKKLKDMTFHRNIRPALVHNYFGQKMGKTKQAGKMHKSS